MKQILICIYTVRYEFHILVLIKFVIKMEGKFLNSAIYQPSKETTIFAQ